MLLNTSKVLRVLVSWWNQSLNLKVRLWLILGIIAILVHFSVGVLSFFFYRTDTIYKLNSARDLSFKYPVMVSIVPIGKRFDHEATQLKPCDLKVQLEKVANPSLTSLVAERPRLKNISKPQVKTKTKTQEKLFVKKSLESKSAVSKTVKSERTLQAKKISHDKILPAVMPLQGAQVQKKIEPIGDVLPVESIEMSRKEYDEYALKIYTVDVISRAWKPVKGLPGNLSCTILFMVDMSGRAHVEKIIQSSGVRVFDSTVRKALMNAQFDKQAWGKEFEYTFDNQ
jgi:hypothetical protein